MLIEGFVDQHAEEADFLWHLRKLATRAPHYDLSDIAELDQRIDAHIKGLVFAGDVGWDRCKPETHADDFACSTFVAAEVALHLNDNEKLKSVLVAAQTSENAADGLSDALGRMPRDASQRWITRLLATKESVYHRIAIDAAVLQNIPLDAELQTALKHDDAKLRTSALRATGKMGKQALMAATKADLNHDDDACRFNAAWATTLLDGEHTPTALSRFALEPNPYQEEAVELLCRILDESLLFKFLKQLSAAPETRRLMLKGIGASGNARLVPILFDHMAVADLSRAAGEAFSMITGLDIANEHFDTDEPEGFEDGPNDDPNDENVDRDPDDDLPWPHLPKIQNWWSTNASNFSAQCRYLCGKPLTINHLLSVLEHGLQKQRLSAALELALLQPGKPMFNIDTRSSTQMAQLQQLKTT